ncbi:unnamed protein product [Brachionus calyciflorus]|uniref:Kynureninase n=1 Tax=Brachionus calyciflorus TaxID=104777 RepID=A0A813YYV6_9BILA|nr:unnamed protein product [Brachionus calyciflorus]
MNDSTETHPFCSLDALANEWNLDLFSEEFSLELDKRNIWPSNRDKFHYPKLKDLSKVDLSLVEDPEAECIYMCGNSLGLQAKTAREYVNKEFDKWAKIGVYGHFEGELPWAECNEPLRPAMARLVGAKTEEVDLMNFLTVNLHLMMVSFYRPNEKRFKILLEEKAFPSDHYVVESQIKLNNLNPEECLLLLRPREGELTLRTEDILRVIEQEGDQIALVLLSGVHYFTGQLFKINEITQAAHSKGCYIGWDLAHAVGNVDLKLHDWNVDFAAWCTYKYLNSGAGSIGGVFLHEKHFEIANLKKLDGWWSHRFDTRFEMSNKIEYAIGASAYALSNPSILLCSCLKASLDIFDEIGIENLRKKSKILTAYMEALLNKTFDRNNNSETGIEYITPTDPEERGAQISIRFKNNVRLVHDELEKRGVVCDFREPDVLRFAPVPLYNTFSDIYKMVKTLENCFKIVFRK